MAQQDLGGLMQLGLEKGMPSNAQPTTQAQKHA